MLTTSFIEIEAIELTLPPKSDDSQKPSLSDSKKDDKNLVIIDIAASGKLYLNQQYIAKSDFEDEVRKVFGRHAKDKKVIVRAEKKVPVQKLVSIMDVVHVSGGRNLAVAKWDGYVEKSINFDDIREIPALVVPESGYDSGDEVKAVPKVRKKKMVIKKNPKANSKPQPKAKDEIDELLDSWTQ